MRTRRQALDPASRFVNVAPMPTPIVLDTDMGSDVDDALCLTLALAAPELKLEAITHVSKDTRLRARISKRILALAGRAEIPVFAGRALPIAGPDRFMWYGHEGVGILDPAERSDAGDVETEDAVDAMVRLFTEKDGLELVAVGPLTNVAAALEEAPAFARRIRRLTLMGGFINASQHEYNLCADPAAALRVFRSGIPIRLIPADVTLQTWLRARDVAEIERCGTPLHQAIARAIRIWTPTMHARFRARRPQMTADNAAFLHDPLTLACAYDESFCHFEEIDIHPEVTGEVALLRALPALDERSVRIRCATGVHAERFRCHFLTRVKQLSSPQPLR